jgi:hexosaminidase
MRIIPNPSSIETLSGAFVLRKESGVSCDAENIASNLNDFCNLLFGYRLNKGDDIVFKLAPKGLFCDNGYKLAVNPNGIIIEGDESGLFYGLQTLKPLLAADGGKIPCAIIEDKPKLEYRGFMLDCSRHFFNVDFIKKLIDLCSLLKFNYFHWHLTDDQGWRVEIEKYPLLADIGSVRSETNGDGKAIKGFYTKTQIKEIIAFAAERYVNIIPEFDMPGHTMAAISAYPWLSCRGEEVRVATTFGIKPMIMCSGKESTFIFIEEVLKEMADLFPCKYFHIGGDEALKTEWRECQHCQKVIKESAINGEEELQAYFTGRVIDILGGLGKEAIVWNEAANSGKLSPNCIMQYWQDGRNPKRVKAELEKGRRFINSKFTPLYLDYPHGMHPLRSVYKFDPIVKGISKKAEKCIFGIEAPLWTEYVVAADNAESMIFPRLLAVAEQGFGEKTKISDFKERVESFNKILQLYGVKYTPLKQSDPIKIMGLVETIKHFLSIMNKELIKSMFAANKETKRSKKAGIAEVENDSKKV